MDNLNTKALQELNRTLKEFDRTLKKFTQEMRVSNQLAIARYRDIRAMHGGHVDELQNQETNDD